MTIPIKYMETTHVGTALDEFEHRHMKEEVTVWMYTDPKVLAQDLCIYFGEHNYAALQQRPISPQDAVRAEYWGSVGYKCWIARNDGVREAFNLGPYVFPDMTPQKT